MAIRIEIRYIKHHKAWEVRFGDLTGSSTSINIPMKDVLDEIKDTMEEERGR